MHRYKSINHQYSIWLGSQFYMQLFYTGIQALYGTNAMTFPPPSSAPDRQAPNIPAGAPDICQSVRFDAIFNHVVDGELKTFAFYEDYYMEIRDFSLAQVILVGKTIPVYVTRIQTHIVTIHQSS